MVTIGSQQGMGDAPCLAVLLVFGGLQLALSLDYWDRENKLIPRLNQRLAVEFMLLTCTPIPGKPGGRPSDHAEVQCPKMNPLRTDRLR